MKRVGITQRVDVVASYGERRDALDQAWTPLLLDLGFMPIPLPNCLPSPEHALRTLGLQAVLLSGGNDLAGLPGATNVAPERDALEATLLDAALAMHLPVLGVCRGMQRIVTHLGGTLRPVLGHIAEPHPIEAVPHNPLGLVSRSMVNSFHGFGVHPSDLPATLRAIATAPDGTVEAVTHVSAPISGIMWHPERALADDDDRALVQRALTA